MGTGSEGKEKTSQRVQSPSNIPREETQMLETDAKKPKDNLMNMRGKIETDDIKENQTECVSTTVSTTVTWRWL